MEEDIVKKGARLERILLELMVYRELVGMAMLVSCGELAGMAMLLSCEELVGMVMVGSCEQLVGLVELVGMVMVGSCEELVGMVMYGSSEAEEHRIMGREAIAEVVLIRAVCGWVMAGTEVGAGGRHLCLGIHLT